jgi:L-cystine transport system permease protein
MIDVEYLWIFLKNGVSFIPQTFYLAFISLVLGLTFGGLIAIARVYRVKVLAPVFTVIIAVLKAIPTNLIMLMASLIFTNCFNDFMAAIGSGLTVRDVDMLYIAAVALVLSSIASFSENIRSALMAVPQIQYDAGYSIGLTSTQNFFRIILPQAFLVMLPSLTGNLISLIKMTSLASLLGVVDVLNGCLKKASASYKFLEAYIAAALIYWVISLAIDLLGRLCENRIGRYRKLG